MRDIENKFYYDETRLYKSLMRIYFKGVSESDLLVLTNHVVIDPTLRHGDSAFNLKTGWSRQQLIELACLTYCLGEEHEFLAWELRKSIDLAREKFSCEDQLIFENLLYHRNIESFIEYLIETDYWHSSEFFGFFSPSKVRSMIGKLVYAAQVQQMKVNRPQRKRGYNDKGSRTEDHNRRNPGADYTLNELHEEISRKKKVFDDTKRLIQGLLGQW